MWRPTFVASDFSRTAATTTQMGNVASDFSRTTATTTQMGNVASDFSRTTPGTDSCPEAPSTCKRAIRHTDNPQRESLNLLEWDFEGCTWPRRMSFHDPGALAQTN